MINRLGYSKELSDFTQEQLEQIKANLTVKPEVIPDYDYGQVEPFEVYRTSEKRLYMPKFYAIEKFGPAPKKYKPTVHTDIIFKGSLKEHQINYCKLLLNEMKENDSCIAHMATGGGKTVCALWLAAQLKKKTMIIVHKEFLMNQWIERIKQFIPTAKVGVVRQEKVEIEDRDIIIGMIQTITSRTYPKGTFDSIGFTVFDESHHLAASKFSKVLYKCGSRYSLALSATPKRKDGLTKVLQWFLGTILTNEVKSNILSPSVEIINADYSTIIKPKHNFKGVLNLPDLINQLIVDKKRNDIIAEKSVQLHKTGRKQLILTGRRNHCCLLEKLINDIDKTIITGLYMGNMKEKDLKESNEADIIIATYQSVSEGYDNPTIDTLIMATGIGEITQSVGRILRQKNNNKPLIIDITDKEFLAGQAKKRAAYYKRNEFDIISNTKPEKIEKIDLRTFSFCDD